MEDKEAEDSEVEDDEINGNGSEGKDVAKWEFGRTWFMTTSYDFVPRAVLHC